MSLMQPQPTQTLYEKLQASGGDLTGLVNAAGQELGLPEGQMYRIGMVESGLKPEVKNKRSSATGLYQFTKGTWNEVVTKYGSQYGIPEGSSAKDPVANAILGAAYLNENATNFKDTFGKDPDITDLYMGHFLGQTGRKKFIDAMTKNPEAPALQFTGKHQVKANPNVFFNEDGSPASLAEVYKRFGNKLSAGEDAGNQIAKTKSDIYVDAVRERMMDREFLGQDNQLDIERAVSSQGNFGLTDWDAKPFSDTVSDYGLQKSVEVEERSFFDEAWDASMAELRLSSAGRYMNEKALNLSAAITKDLGIPQDWDSAAAQVAAAFSDLTPEEMLRFDLNKAYEVPEELWPKIYNSGIDKKWTEYIKTAKNRQDLIEKVQLASEMQKADETRKKADLGAGLVGGIVGALGDPLTFAGGTAIKAGTIGGRMFVAAVEGSVGSVASELGLEMETKGAVEANVTAAALGGFVAGGALRGLGEAFSNFPASIRMRARQEALDSGIDDITARPDIEVPEGQRYVDHPEETGAVVDEYGNTHSATSVGNPRILDEAQQEHIRANKGFELGGANMLSYSLLRSESNEVRGIASDLVRSPTGIQGGGSGKTGMTSEDIISRLEGIDNVWYTKAMKAREAAYNNSMFDISGSRTAREDMERTVGEAIESGNLSSLSKEQREYAELITELFVRKFEEASNPSMFGNPDAPPVFTTTRDASRYLAQVFEEGKVNAAKMRFGGWEGLQETIKGNWLTQWKINRNGVREKFREAYSDEIETRKKAAEEDIQSLTAAKEGTAEKLDEKVQQAADDYKEAVKSADKAKELNGNREKRKAKLEDKLQYFSNRVAVYEEKLRRAAKDTTKMKYADMVKGYKLRIEQTKVDIRDIDALLAKSSRRLSELSAKSERKSNLLETAEASKSEMDAKFAQAYKAADEGQILEDLFNEYIEKKSYGISRNGDFTHSAGLEDANLDDSLVGIENNNFTKERNIFDSAFSALASDGQPFSINDLRHFDILNLAQMYNRRMNGDVAIHAATGSDTKTLKDKVVNLPEGKDKHNLDQLVRLITGRARADNTAPAFNAVMKGLQDLSFASSNAQMWVNNLSEVSGWATNRIMFMARNGVPALKQLFNPETKFTKADLKDFRDGIFGHELNNALQPSYINVKDALIRQGVGERAAKVAAGVRVAGATVASPRFNPYTKFLNGTQELLTGMARGGVISDITQEAFGGIKINPAALKNASVTPEQYRGVLDMLREHVKVVDGEFKPDVATIRRDPRTNDLWRLADYIASDSVMRTGKVGMNYVMRPNSLVNLALQFKSFMLKGLNSRTVRMFHESFHGKAVDNVMRVIIGSAITGALWSMQARYRSLGIPESERQAYLEKMLDDGMITYQSFSRQAELGPLLGSVNLVLGAVTGEDAFRLGRSTVDPKSSQYGDPLRADVTSMKSVGEAAGQAVYDTFPAARTLTAPYVMGSSILGWANADYGYQSDMQLRSFYEALGSLAPNAPEVQWFINQMAEESGASGKYMK